MVSTCSRCTSLRGVSSNKIGQPHDPVHGGPDLVAHVGQKLALGSGGRFGGPLQCGLPAQLFADNPGLALNAETQKHDQPQSDQHRKGRGGQHRHGVLDRPPRGFSEHYNVAGFAQQHIEPGALGGGQNVLDGKMTPVTSTRSPPRSTRRKAECPPEAGSRALNIRREVCSTSTCPFAVAALSTSHAWIRSSL